MRIEGLDLKQPTVLPAIGADEFQPAFEGPGLRMALLRFHIPPIDPILTEQPAAVAFVADRMLRDFRVGDLSLPRISFLPPNVVPSRVLTMVRSSSGFPIMIMIADQMGVDPLLAQKRRQGIVERLERAPASVQKVVSAGQQVPSRGHAGHAAHPVVVERDASVGQPAKVRSVYVLAAVRRQHMAVQRVEHDDNRFHDGTLSLGVIEERDEYSPRISFIIASEANKADRTAVGFFSFSLPSGAESSHRP